MLPPGGQKSNAGGSKEEECYRQAGRKATQAVVRRKNTTAGRAEMRRGR